MRPPVRRLTSIPSRNPGAMQTGAACGSSTPGDPLRSPGGGHLFKQRDHGAPGPARAVRVIRDGRSGLDEAVAGSAQDVVLPINAGCGHLGFEHRALYRRRYDPSDRSLRAAL